MKKNKTSQLQPFLKWAGGKRQLLKEIEKYLPSLANSRYYEPFVGGGAVLFHAQPGNAVINDYNSDLITAYNCIKQNVNELIEKLKEYEILNDADNFYRIRALDRTDEYARWNDVQKTARLIYLNKTCYNGLFRMNSQGFFNTPFGNYKRPAIVNEPVLRAVSEYLNTNNITIHPAGDFEVCCENIEASSVVYFDPPYDQFEHQANFVGYTQNGFTQEDQERLRDLADRLVDNDCYVLISNSNTPFIQRIYSDTSRYQIHVVRAKRNINSDPNKRGDVEEVIIVGKKRKK